MRQIGVKNLKTGMLLGRPIYDQNYRKLLAEGTMIDPLSVQRIREMGFYYVYILESGTESIQVEDLIGIEARKIAAQAMNQIALFDTDEVARERYRRTGTSSEREPGMDLETKQLVNRAIEMMVNDVTRVRRPVYFPGVHLAENQLINHSTNVAILSLLIGLGFTFARAEMILLAKAAFYHDLGKLRLDPDLASVHPLDRTEEQRDLYKMHPQMGAVLLERDPTTNIHITMAVLQHHERQDESGFPAGMKGSGEPPKVNRENRGTIHRFAEIIAAADYFDNLVSGKIERTLFTPIEAVQEIVKNTPSWFNEHITQMAMSVINTLPEGSNVEILESSTYYKYVGYRGVVSKVNRENLNRPMVTLLYDQFHERLGVPVEVDFADDFRLKLDFLYDL
ncbi:MAG: HD domain-containing phosphohydrolase [bacterium]